MYVHIYIYIYTHTYYTYAYAYKFYRPRNVTIRFLRTLYKRVPHPLINPEHKARPWPLITMIITRIIMIILIMMTIISIAICNNTNDNNKYCLWAQPLEVSRKVNVEVAARGAGGGGASDRSLAQDRADALDPYKNPPPAPRLVRRSDVGGEEPYRRHNNNNNSSNSHNSSSSSSSSSSTHNIIS